MIGAPAAARSFTDRPLAAMALSVAIALVIVWIAIAASYATNYPVGFFVGSASAVSYALGRAWAAWRRAGAGAAGTPGTTLSRATRLRPHALELCMSAHAEQRPGTGPSAPRRRWPPPGTARRRPRALLELLDSQSAR